MSQKKDTSKVGEVVEEAPLKSEIDELKRDMRSAQLMHWVESHRTMLTAVAVAVVAGLAGGDLWLDHVKKERASAASMYQGAIAERDSSKQLTLLNDVAKGYAGTTYAVLAEMQLARVDSEHAASHLQAIIDSSQAMDAWKWQARLDLAQLDLEKGDTAKASAELSATVGPAYEQLRQYLLARAASDDATRKTHLQNALAAESYDADLKKKIERMLGSSAS